MDFQSETGRIFLEDESGRLLAEVTFPSVSARVADIRHTFVDDSLRDRAWPAGSWRPPPADPCRGQKGPADLARTPPPGSLSTRNTPTW